MYIRNNFNDYTNKNIYRFNPECNISMKKLGVLKPLYFFTYYIPYIVIDTHIIIIICKLK